MLKKALGMAVLMCSSTLMHAVEVQPIKTIKNPNAYGPDEISFYKIANPYSVLMIQQQPLWIENNSNTAGFHSDIDADCEYLEKIYQQGNQILLITSTCAMWYGAKSAQTSYQIYQFNESATLIASEQIHFDEALDIHISELSSGVKIQSSQSPRTGRIYHYEFQDGQLHDFSTATQRSALAKEKERSCRGFYDRVYTKYQYQPHMVLGNDLYNTLSSADYSWVSDRVKQSEILSAQLDQELKTKRILQRKNMAYALIKQKYC